MLYTDHTCVLLKHEALQRGNVGGLIAAMEGRGYTLSAMKLTVPFDRAAVSTSGVPRCVSVKRNGLKQKVYTRYEAGAVQVVQSYRVILLQYVAASGAQGSVMSYSFKSSSPTSWERNMLSMTVPAKRSVLSGSFAVSTEHRICGLLNKSPGH